MSEYLQLFANIRKRREMYVGTSSYDALVAFFMGFNIGNEEGLLEGFHEWLVIKADGGGNLSWGALVAGLAFPESARPRALIESSEKAEEVACMKLFDLFEAYHRERTERGLRKIFLDYEAWLRNQDWYGPESPDWYEPPDAD